MTTFNQHVEKQKSYDKDLWLGILVWYTVHELKIGHQEFCKLLIDAGLDQHILPKPPRATDVFKRACSDMERKGVPTLQHGVKQNFLIRTVDRDRDNIWNQIVVETVDQTNKRLSYLRLIEVHFDRETETIARNDIAGPNAAMSVAYDIYRDIENYYDEWRDSVNSGPVRTLIRKALRDCNATTVRPSGGVYFVRAAYQDTMEALESAVSRLPNNAEVHTMPLLDNGKQREMLKKAFEAESIDEADRLITEVRDILENQDSITQDRMKKLNDEAQYLITKCADYSDLLNDSLEQASSRLEVMQHQLIAVLDKVKI